MWLLSDDFGERVRGWWDSYTVLGNLSCRLVQKLKLLKIDLRQWNREVFGKLQTQKVLILTVLQGLDEKDDRGILFEEDMARQDTARKDFGHVARMEEISFRQKSRCLWLKDGDRNTSFFHRMANAHRRVTQIGRLRVNGVVLSSTEEITMAIVGFYEYLFRPVEEVWRLTLDGFPFDLISEADYLLLESVFTEEEVFKVLWSMLGDKAPGPDGFSIAFL
ncbi:uncharacterized protein LOC114287836 [Camellia sinensis]|uniref:uncharacterized protein LOC114287836 n=1 Tax=Camellia sinensis TaxID=4442 RepID=UPI001035DD30|nr:uncharacterized protein LOC114287836 [Camellia sinensis]